MILHPPINPIAINILSLKIHWYGVIMAFAILIGIVVSSLICSKKYSKNDTNIFLDMVPMTVISAILGARLFYVIGEWNYYSNNLSEILMINHGGISIYGALIFGVIAIITYCKKYKLNMYKYSDIIAVVMPLCQSIGRWGNFINQEAYGLPYNGFLRLYIDNSHRFLQFNNVEYYHPTFLYESILDLILFIVLITIFYKFKNIKNGTATFLYLALYALIRLFVESYRIDSVLNVSGIHIASIISVIIFAVAAIFLFRIYALKK